MKNTEEKVFEILDEQLPWLRVYDKLTNKKAGGTLSADELIYWVDEHLGLNTIRKCLKQG